AYAKDAKASRFHCDHRVSFTTFAVAILLLLSAAATARAESVLRFVPHADLTIIDPHWTGAYITRNYGYMERWGVRNDSYGQPLLAAASAIEATGDNEFRIALKTPFPVLEALGTMTSPSPFMLPERLALTDPFTQIKEAVGSGPFKMAMADW